MHTMHSDALGKGTPARPPGLKEGQRSPRSTRKVEATILLWEFQSVSTIMSWDMAAMKVRLLSHCGTCASSSLGTMVYHMKSSMRMSSMGHCTQDRLATGWQRISRGSLRLRHNAYTLTPPCICQQKPRCFNCVCMLVWLMMCGCMSTCILESFSRFWPPTIGVSVNFYYQP